MLQLSALVTRAVQFGVGLLIPVTIGSSAALACSVPGQGNFGFWWAGGSYAPSAAPYSVKSSMNKYNPSPVYGMSSLYTMLATNTGNNGFGYYAQVGWKHENHLSYNEFVFLEYVKDNAGGMSTVDNMSGSVVPSGTLTYEVDKLPYGQFDFCWGTTCKSEGNASWTPDHIENFNEIHYYRYAAPTSFGDHAAGDTANVVHIYNVQYLLFQSMGWANANLVYQGSGGSHLGSSANYQIVAPAQNNPGYNWTIYDGRCSN
ncbi:MAG: hypothetical protein ACRDFX_09385 [Chloroflexota bacterium]